MNGISTLLLSCLLSVPALAQNGGKPAKEQASLEGLRGQRPERIFKTHKKRGTLVFVGANRSGASAWNALRELEDLGAFELVLDVPDFKEELIRSTVTLALEDEEALGVARLIATVAGFDLVEDRIVPKKGESGPGKLIATIVRPPSPASKSGRDRLREQSLRWYRTLMQSEMRKNSETASAEARVHVDMALLYMQRKQYPSAAREFAAFTKMVDQEHPFVPEALLREASCYFELSEYDECVAKAHQIMALYQDSKVSLAAALILSKGYLGMAQRYLSEGKEGIAQMKLDVMVSSLELYLHGYRDRDEFPELLLALAEAQRLRHRPDLTLLKIKQLEGIVDPILLPDRLWASAFFLKGDALVKTGHPEGGEQLLWQFIRRKKKDPRVADAWISLASAQLQKGDPMQCVFAARKALQLGSKLRPDLRDAAVVAEARGLLAIGKVEEASTQLDIEIQRRGPEKVPDLVVELAEALLEHGQPERAKILLMRVRRVPGAIGDTARVLLLETEARQGNHQALILRAIEIGESVRDPEKQARLAELVGDAYVALGRVDRAAEAYSGRIR